MNNRQAWDKDKIERAKAELARRESTMGSPSDGNNISNIPGYALNAAMNLPGNLWGMAKQIPGAIGYAKEHPVNAARDVMGGIGRGSQHLAGALGEAGQWIGDTAAKKLYKDFTGKELNVPKVNIREELGLEGGNQVDLGKMIESNDPNHLLSMIGQYGMGGASGGAKMLPMLLANAATGAVQANPDERLKSAVEGTVGVGIPYGATKAISKYMNKGKAKNQPINPPSEPTPNYAQELPGFVGEGEFRKTDVKPPEYLNPEKLQVNSENIANELTSQLSGGKNLESTAKNLGSLINKTYEEKHDLFSGRYKKIFEKPTNEENYFTGEPFKVKELPIDHGKYKKDYMNAEIPDSGVDVLHKKYINSSTTENAHWLQSELGSEIGYMKNQEAKGNLDAKGKNQLKTYIKMWKTIKEDLHEKLKEIDPEVLKAYEENTRDWESQVRPYHIDKNLKDIATGKTKNPTTSQLKSIFMSPEESINTVTSHLGPEAKRAITYIGMGKTKGELTPKGLVAGKKTLEKGGLSSYINPEHEQLFSALEKQLSHENDINLINQQKEKLSQQLMSEREAAEKARISESNARKENRERAAKESQKRFEEHKTQINNLQKELNKQNEMKKRKVEKLVKTIVGATVGYKLGGLKGEMVGGMIGSQLTKKYTKKPTMK